MLNYNYTILIVAHQGIAYGYTKVGIFEELGISLFSFYFHLFFFQAILFLTYYAQDFAQS